MTFRLLDLVSCIFNQPQVMQLLADHKDWGLKMYACHWLHILFCGCQMFGLFYLYEIMQVEYWLVVKGRYVLKTSTYIFSGEYDPFNCK